MRSRVLSYRLLLILLLIALTLSLVPVLALSPYALPCADDFTYGNWAHQRFAESGSFLGALRGAWDTVVNFYLTWQGTYSAAFLMALQPSVFGEGLYFLTPVILLGALLAGTFVFCIALARRVFGLPAALGGIVAALAVFLSVQTIPSPVQGLFWYNGAVFYTFFHGLALLTTALGIRLVRDGGVGRAIALCLLAFLLGGGNYVTALACAILGAASLILLPLCRQKGWQRLILPFLVLMLGFALSILAPGNSVRQNSTGHAPNALWSILYSFLCAYRQGVHWLSLPLAGILLFLVPVFWSALSGCSFRFRFPILVSLFSFCLYSAMFCPPIYALGYPGDFRLLNIIYYTYVLLLMGNLFYWMGWISAHVRRSPREGVGLPAFAAAAAACLICLGLHLNGGSYTATMAYSLLRSGEAREYAACGQRRLAMLQDPAVTDAVLEPFEKIPYVLFFDDVTEDPGDWRNLSVAEYYGKRSVVLGSPDDGAERSAP